MPIEFSCPSCQQTLRVPDTATGKQAQCPKCKTLIVVPGTSPPAEDDFIPLSKPSWPAESPAQFTPVGPTNNPYASMPMPAGSAPRPTAQSGPIINVAVDISDVISHAWECFTRDFGVLFAGYMVAAILPLFALIPLLIIPIVAGGPEAMAIGVVLCAMLAGGVSFYFWLGQMQMAMASARGEPVEIGMIFYRESNTVSATIGIFLFSIGVGFLTLLFCIGLVVLVLYWPVGFLIVDKKVGLSDAFAMARRITNDNVGTTLLLAVVTMAISFGASSVCFLVVYLVGPLLTVSWATAYLMMSGRLTRGSKY